MTVDDIIGDGKEKETPVYGKVINHLQKFAVKPGVDLAGIVKKLKERRKAKKHGTNA